VTAYKNVALANDWERRQERWPQNQMELLWVGDMVVLAKDIGISRRANLQVF
jgi:hypothetical protein